MGWALTISVRETRREMSINADVRKDDHPFDHLAKRQGRLIPYLHYIWRDNVLGLYGPSASPQIHGRLVVRGSYLESR